jgi:hypothetical protein
MNRTVDTLKRPQAFFVNRFFPQVETSDKEEVFFDIEHNGEKRRLAPFVHPKRGGKLVEGAGFTTKSFKPAYIKDKRTHDSDRPFKRVAGESIGTGQELTPLQRRQLNVRRDLKDQTEMLTRRMEVMAVEALRTGKITVKGDGIDAVVDFQRDPDATITLTGGARWGQTGVKPQTDLEDWAMDRLQKTGTTIRSIVMDVDAWRAFRDSVDVEKRLDLRRVESGTINVGVLPEGVQYKGNDGTFDYWVVADWYVDPETNTEVALLPSGTVLGVGDIMGVRHFGAIKDEAAGFQPREYFVKSWTIEDPSERIFLMQSAPLLVPYRPDAAFCATVL